MFNLLPKQYKQALRWEILSRIFYTTAFFVTLWGLVFGVVIFVSLQYMSIQNDTLTELISVADALEENLEVKNLESQIEEFNALLFSIKDIREAGSSDVSFFIERIAQIVPAGSNLEELTYTSEANKITLRGHANLRSQIITLQNRLEEDEYFVDVQAPLSNLLKAEDIDFSFILILRQDND